MVFIPITKLLKLSNVEILTSIMTLASKVKVILEEKKQTSALDTVVKFARFNMLFF